jgi:peptidoglycan/LPS O-acetylase OafA/YrhL
LVIDRLNFRKEINGLRALAVSAVVIFHAGKNILPGGFVGVDIFFVISGYLISRILLAEMRDSDFNLYDFYAKRIKRIFPALIIVLLSVWASAWLLFDPQQFLELGRHQLDGSFFILNFRLMHESNYFDIDSQAKPLLHLWSLSIEEQFYIVWPILLLAIFRMQRKAVAPAIALVFGASLISSLALTPHAATMAFYLPLSRAWELALGSALAYRELFWTDLAAARGPKDPLRNFAVIAGVALMIAAMFLLDEGQPFPGWRALTPTLGCAMVIANPGAAWSDRLLGHRLTQKIGDISYPLYLWHWPLLSFAATRFPGGASPPFILLLMVLAIFLAWLTHVLVEINVAELFKRHENAVVAALALSLVGVAFMGRWATLARGFPGRYPPEIARLFDFAYDPASRHARPGKVCFDDLSDVPPFKDYDEKTVVADGLQRQCFGVADSNKPTVVIMGDSHAGHLSNGIADEFESTVNIVEIDASYCAPLVEHVLEGNGKAGTRRCEIINKVRFDLLKKLKPDLLIVGSYFWQYLSDPAWRYPGYESELVAGAASLRAAGVRNILVVGEVPLWMPTLPALIAREAMAHKPIELYSADGLRPESLFVDQRLRALPWPQGVAYVSLVDALCGENGCLRRVGNRLPDDLISIDYGHFSYRGSLYIGHNILAGPIRAILEGAPKP